jgi:hypothetical protein
MRPICSNPCWLVESYDGERISCYHELKLNKPVFAKYRRHHTRRVPQVHRDGCCFGAPICSGTSSPPLFLLPTPLSTHTHSPKVLVNEPTVSETVSILRGISHKYEVHHGVRILDGALISAATLAHRYLTSRRLPDAAIDLVDEACASCVFLRLSSTVSLLTTTQSPGYSRDRSVFLPSHQLAN